LLRAGLVDGYPQRAQRLDVRQQIVDYGPHASETAAERVADRHAVQSAEGVVRHDQIAAVEGYRVQALDAAGHAQLVEPCAEHLLRFGVAIAVQE
jgi:hypothetical protein